MFVRQEWDRRGRQRVVRSAERCGTMPHHSREVCCECRPTSGGLAFEQPNPPSPVEMPEAYGLVRTFDGGSTWILLEPKVAGQ